MYKMKSFLARLWVSFHYEGFPCASFWDPDESLWRDVPKVPLVGKFTRVTERGPAPSGSPRGCCAGERRGRVSASKWAPAPALPWGGSSKEHLIYKAGSTAVSQYQPQL